MRLVLDTCVLVSALRSSYGASRVLLDLARMHSVRLVASSALYLEYEAVLSRPEQLKAHKLSAEEIEQVLVDLASFTDLTRIHYQYRPQLPDPNDEMVLEAAINGHARVIATHNVKDFLPAANRFAIEILTPGRILREWRVR